MQVGNEVGPEFTYEKVNVNCSECAQPIAVGQPRFKEWRAPYRSLCERCAPEGDTRRDSCMTLRNNIEEVRARTDACAVFTICRFLQMVYHQFVACDACGACPLPGVRFRCTVCSDVDICESCLNAGKHPDHRFAPLEAPAAGGGYAVHRGIGCAGCSAYPIIGTRFCCMECPRVSMCQKCFFLGKEPEGHTVEHEIEMVAVPLSGTQIYCKWYVFRE